MAGWQPGRAQAFRVTGRSPGAAGSSSIDGRAMLPVALIPPPVVMWPAMPLAVAQSATTASALATMSSPGSSPWLAARRLSIRPEMPRRVSGPPS